MSPKIDVPQIQFLSRLKKVEPKKSILEPEFVKIDPDTPKKKSRFKFKRSSIPTPSKRILFTALFSLFAVVVLVSVFGALPAYAVYKKAMVLKDQASLLQEAVKAQSMPQVKSEMSKFREDLLSLQSDYNRLRWTGSLPLVGPYWKDGEAGIKAGVLGLDAASELVVTVEPYADIIGFTTDPSKQPKSGEDTANDRIEFLVQTIGDIVPKLDGISLKAQEAQQLLNQIDPNRYPEEFRGFKLRENMKKGLELVDEATTFITEGKPLLEAAPFLLGVDSPRTYLVLFQNDKELRPTGGFLTAYSIMQMSKGKVQPVSSSDIYSLDAKYRPNITAPEPIVSYIAGPYAISNKLFLRDMNWNPDFKASMDMFSAEAKKAGMQEVDGIIAVDTHVLVKILDVLGEIGVSGFGNFSTKTDPRCNCPQVIYELEEFADVEGPVVWDPNTGKIVFAPKNYGKNRKEIVGPLMNSVLGNALGQPKDKLPDLFQAGWEALTEKHVLLYMFDEKSQKAAETFGIAGKLEDFNGDYLHINDANLGGRKSNLYVTSEVHQDVKIAKDGTIEKTLEITYKNPQAHDGWLNSVLPNWTRVYVPQGSTLISQEGFENATEAYDESGKTVFSGGFKLRPQGVAKITLKYTLPFKAQNNEYNLFVQKQPGVDKVLYSTTLGKQKDELFLLTDKVFKFKY